MAMLTLGVVLLLVIWQLFHLYRRNRMLHQKHQELHEELQLRKQEEAQDEVQVQDDEQPQTLPKEKPSANQQLYQKICKIMEEQRLYMQAEMNREKLASILGTNYKYVADAIRECSDDKTVNQFINGYRVTYAQQLLRDHPEKKMAQVGLESGFANDTTFYRVFKSITGFTPSEWLSSVSES